MILNHRARPNVKKMCDLSDRLIFKTSKSLMTMFVCLKATKKTLKQEEKIAWVKL